MKKLVIISSLVLVFFSASVFSQISIRAPFDSGEDIAKRNPHIRTLSNAIVSRADCDRGMLIVRTSHGHTYHVFFNIINQSKAVTQEQVTSLCKKHFEEIKKGQRLSIIGQYKYNDLTNTLVRAQLIIRDDD